jgi:hypothetical protein
MSSPISNAVDRYVYSGKTGVQYKNLQTKSILDGASQGAGGASNANAGSIYGKTTPIPAEVFLRDVAQSHHFTVKLGEGKDFTMYKTPYGTFSPFLPVKNINLNYTSYENMSIPLAIFGDFPLLSRKRVSTISLTCYDTDNNKLEHELRAWEASCFPLGKYAAYMEDIAKKFEYSGYNTKGQRTLVYSVYVIPSGNVSISRDYSNNDAKMISFSLVCVGDGTTCATGKSSNTTGDYTPKIIPGVKDGPLDIVDSGISDESKQTPEVWNPAWLPV